MQRKISVALVTSSPNNAESLALQYVATSVEKAGHTAGVSTFRGVSELEGVARRIAKATPELLGVSIQSGIAAIDNLAFINRVRALGYSGHITCGGTFATLCRRRLFDQCRHIDSIIRHDGEIPIAFLANAIANDEGFDSLPGVSTMYGDGLPAPVGIRTHLDVRPTRQFRKLYAGVPSAEISAVRGCFGNCSYCGLKALRREATFEARQCGMTTREISSVGVGSIRRRKINSVADEMAYLYHEKNVRFFHLVDENHLPRDSVEATRVLNDLSDALDVRGVRDRAVNLMLRADAATQPVCEALDRLGLVRCLLGVESTTEEGLKKLGRGNGTSVNKMAMNNLEQRNIAFHFNVLLVTPDSTIDSIWREVDGLREVRGGLLDPFALEVYEGTTVFEGLRKAGRLEGGPMLWHYWLQEPAAKRFAHLFYRIKRDVFAKVNMTAYGYEVLGALAVAKRLKLLKTDSAQIDALASALIKKHNDLWISILESARAHAVSESDDETIHEFLEETRLSAARLVLDLRRLEAMLERGCRRPLKSEIYYPSAAAAVAMALSILCGSACVSCNHVGSGTDAGPDTSVDDTDTTTDTDTDTNTDTETDTYTCSEQEAHEEGWGAVNTAIDAGCDNICDQGEMFEYRLILDEEGHMIDMEREDGIPIDQELIDCYIAALEGQTFPCMAERDHFWLWCGVLLS